MGNGRRMRMQGQQVAETEAEAAALQNENMQVLRMLPHDRNDHSKGSGERPSHRPLDDNLRLAALTKPCA